MIARLARMLRRDVRGVTIVEFAIVSPVLILLIAGSIELARMAMIRSTLEGAVGDAARLVLVDLQASEDDRDTALREVIQRRMANYPTSPGRSLQIETQVFRDFGSAYPEAYEDVNGNGQYDPGEPFEDRNRNGVRDVAVQLDGRLGGPGDVVSYTATFPARPAFPFLTEIMGMTDGIDLRATVVLRNEPVTRRTSGGGT